MIACELCYFIREHVLASRFYVYSVITTSSHQEGALRVLPVFPSVFVHACLLSACNYSRTKSLKKPEIWYAYSQWQMQFVMLFYVTSSKAQDISRPRIDVIYGVTTLLTLSTGDTVSVPTHQVTDELEEFAVHRCDLWILNYTKTIFGRG